MLACVRGSRPAKGHKTYPYLLGGLRVERPNQVWCADITYIPMCHGFLYLVAIMDWHTRKVLAWRISNTLEADFCVEALNEAIHKFGPPEIWRIWRQVEEPASGLPKRVCRRDIPVGCKVVQYDDGAGRQDRHQNLFDIRGEGGTVHRALDDPRCYQPVRRQACNERLRAPVAKGGVHLKPLAARGAAPQPGEVCLHRGLVNEHKPLWLQSHGRHAARQPIVPRLPYPGAAALGGHQRFFLYVNPRRDSSAAIEE